MKEAIQEMSKEDKPLENEMTVRFDKEIRDEMHPVNRELPKSFLNLTALIRSIQRHDGHEPCFRTDREQCGEIDCNWRSHCIGDQMCRFKG